MDIFLLQRAYTCRYNHIKLSALNLKPFSDSQLLLGREFFFFATGMPPLCCIASDCLALACHQHVSVLGTTWSLLATD